MALGLLDRCCNAETMMKYPAIYKVSQDRSDFNIKVNIQIFIKNKKEFLFIDFLDLVS
jgi:hypothetical protein